MTPEQEKMRVALAPFVPPRLLAEAAEAALGAFPTSISPPGLCGVSGRGGTICTKPRGHAKRHRYGDAEDAQHRHVPVERPWGQIQSFKQQGSGSRSYEIRVGNPVKVIGERGLWKVIRIERHREHGQVNVEVTQDRTGHSRIFRSEKIVYKRPPKVLVP